MYTYRLGGGGGGGETTHADFHYYDCTDCVERDSSMGKGLGEKEEGKSTGI